MKHLYRRTDNADVRSRCQMILLSAQGHSAVEIAGLTFFDQDTVLFWFDRYEADGLDGLQDRPRSGRPPKLTGPSRDDLQQAVDQDSCQVQDYVAQHAGRMDYARFRAEGRPIGSGAVESVARLTNVCVRAIL